MKRLLQACVIGFMMVASTALASSPAPNDNALPNGLHVRVTADPAGWSEDGTIGLRAVVTNEGNRAVAHPGACAWTWRLTAPSGARVAMGEAAAACDAAGRAELAPGAGLVHATRWDGRVHGDGPPQQAAPGDYVYQAFFRYYPDGADRLDDFGAAAVVTVPGATSHEDPGPSESTGATPTPGARASAGDGDAYPAWIEAAPPCSGVVTLPLAGVTDARPAAQPRGAAAETSAVDGVPQGLVSLAAQPSHLVRLVANDGTPRVLVQPAAGGDADAAPIDFRYDSFNGVAQVLVSTPGGGHQTMRTTFEGLLEFDDVNGNGRLDDGDVVLQRFDVPQLVHFARTAEDACGVRLAWTYFLTLPQDAIEIAVESGDLAALDAAARFSVRFTNWNVAHETNGVPYVPERAKIDITVDNFPFTRPGTLLAAPVTARSLDVIDTTTVLDGHVLSGPADTPVGLGWLETAETPQSTVPVRTHVAATAPDASGLPSGVRVTFVYPQTSSLLHDPELGVFRTQSGAVGAVIERTLANPVAYAVGALGTVAALGVLAVSRRE